MDKLSREQRRKNMQTIKNKGSKIETILAKALWNKGYRYRKNNKTVFGKPDLTFKKYKIAIFVDGEFWHGKNWQIRKEDHKSNRDFWWKKIQRNIERDKQVNIKLKTENWIVLRFWGDDIKKNLSYCLDVIEENIKNTANEQVS